MKRGKIIFLMAILLIPIISASDVSVWQGQHHTGTTFNTGTFEFNFSVYDALTGGEICYTNTTTLTTSDFGEWRTEQSGVNSACNNASKDYYLNINIDGTDQTPRRRLVVWNSLRKDVDEVSTGNLVLHGVLQGLSPLKLQDEINFIKADGTSTSAIYNAPRESASSLSSDFEDSLIHDIINETNDFGMQECFWDENTETMQMCISGAYLPARATTVSRSLQVVGNGTNKPVNENFTKCEGNKYIDCNPDTTGADLLVEDDIEAIGSIFSQENITVDDTGFFSYLGSLTNRITKLFVKEIDVSDNATIEALIIKRYDVFGPVVLLNNTADAIRIVAAPNITNPLNGAGIQLFGNTEGLFPGDVYIDAGSTSGGQIIMRTGASGLNDRIIVEDDGRVKVLNLTGSGNDYVCVDADGYLFRSDTAC